MGRMSWSKCECGCCAFSLGARIELAWLQPILIHCKASFVHLWSSPAQNSGWNGSRTLTLQTQKLSVGSSSMCPVSGITYLRQEDAAIAALSDGSFHVIYNLFTDPSWTPPPPSGSLQKNPFTSSGKLSSVSRSVFSQAEEGKNQKADVNRINGMTLYDDFGTIAWLHEYVSKLNFRCQLIDCLSSSFLEPVDRRILATSTTPSIIACSSWLRCGKIRTIKFVLTNSHISWVPPKQVSGPVV
jgi:hypothetical protein